MGIDGIAELTAREINMPVLEGECQTVLPRAGIEIAFENVGALALVEEPCDPIECPAGARHQADFLTTAYRRTLCGS